MNPDEMDKLDKEFSNMSDSDVEMNEMNENEETETETNSPRKKKRLNRSLEGRVLTFEIIETGEEIEFDIDKCSEEIVEKLTVHGAWQKLGDSAAGKMGQDIVDSITKVRDALYNGEFNVKQEAGSKITKKQLSDSLANMSPEEAENARKTLASMGIEI
jgi:hypothetical protein